MEKMAKTFICVVIAGILLTSLLFILSPHPITAPGNTEEIHLFLSDNTVTGKGFEKQCGRSIADAEDVYCAFTYNDGRMWLYLSFDADIKSNYNTEAFKTHFNYADVKIPVPGEAAPPAEAYFQNFNPIREITIQSFENGRLKGFLEVVADPITIKTCEPPALASDPISASSLGCYEYRQSSRMITIVFDLTVPDSV